MNYVKTPSIILQFLFHSTLIPQHFTNLQFRHENRKRPIIQIDDRAFSINVNPVSRLLGHCAREIIQNAVAHALCQLLPIIIGQHKGILIRIAEKTHLDQNGRNFRKVEARQI